MKYNVECRYTETWHKHYNVEIEANDTTEAEELAKQGDDICTHEYSHAIMECSETTYTATPVETVETLKEDLRFLGQRLQNLLTDIEGAKIPTTHNAKGIVTAVKAANNALHKLGFETVDVTARDIYAPTMGDLNPPNRVMVTPGQKI